MTPLKKIKVLVGDDDPLMILGLQAAIQQYPDLEYVGSIASPAETLSLIEEKQPNILIMDLAWWGNEQAGIEQIRKVREEFKKVKVIAITAYLKLIEAAKQAGAHEARGKGFSPDDLATIIYAVYKLPDEAPPSMPIESLTERETATLRLLAQGLTDKEIGDALNVATPTVKTYVRSIISKLDAKNRTEAVAIGFKSGLLTTRSMGADEEGSSK